MLDFKNPVSGLVTLSRESSSHSPGRSLHPSHCSGLPSCGGALVMSRDGLDAVTFNDGGSIFTALRNKPVQFLLILVRLHCRKPSLYGFGSLVIPTDIHD